jgi:hypothetical protein
MTPGQAASASVAAAGGIVVTPAVSDAKSASAGAGGEAGAAKVVSLPPPVISSGREPPPVDRIATTQAAGGTVLRDQGANGGSQVAQAAVVALNYGREMTLTWWGRVRKALAKHARDVIPTADEEDALARAGVHGAAVQKHFVWRRSLLWLVVVPSAFSALLVLIDVIFEDYSDWTGFGITMNWLSAVSMWAIPLTAFLGAKTWDRPRRSRQFLLVGFAVAFLGVLIWGIVPISWLFKVEGSADEVAEQKVLIQAIGGLAIFFVLLPVILSLLPGAIRACVRIKVLFPESIVPGWLLLTLTPMYALLLLTLFILVNQVSGNWLLILGMLAVVLAPAAYVVKTGLFIHPIATEEGTLQVERAQWWYVVILSAGFGLLIMYALTGRVLGQRIVGFGKTEGIIGFWSFLWHATQFAVDYIGRSLFITAIAMDYFLLMNVSVWRTTREFEKTEAAGAYEGTIEELGRVLGKE